MTFGEEAVKSAVSKLLSGSDYRDEVINAVNAEFFDFTLKFFHEIVDAKFYGHDINLEWYREHFRRDRNLPYDRETDYRLKSIAGKTYRVEVKLMGRGNPESADMTIARDTDIFIADTLSEQSQSQHKRRVPIIGVGTQFILCCLVIACAPTVGLSFIV